MPHKPRKYNCGNDDVYKPPVYCEDICLRVHLKTKKPPFGNSGPAYEKHLKNLREMTSCIDNKPPHLDVRVLMKTAKLKADCQRMERILKEDALLLASINRIKRTKGKLDTYNPTAGIRFSRMQAMHLEIKKQMVENRLMRKRLMEIKPITITRDECNSLWRRTLVTMDMMARHPLLFSSARPKPPCNKRFPACRPRVYFDVRIGNTKQLDRLVFELYGDICPITVRNFLAICNGGPECRGLTYSGTFIHRIVQGLYCQGGDITQGNGNGGVSIYGGNFKEENFTMKHDRPGNLAMCSFKGKCNSQFTITFRPLSPLDGKRCVFGRLVSGFKTLTALSGAGRKNGRPIEPVCVVECGQYYTMSRYISSMANMRNNGIARVVGEPYWMERDEEEDNGEKKKKKRKRKVRDEELVEEEEEGEEEVEGEEAVEEEAAKGREDEEREEEKEGEEEDQVEDGEPTANVDETIPEVEEPEEDED